MSRYARMRSEMVAKPGIMAPSPVPELIQQFMMVSIFGNRE